MPAALLGRRPLLAYVLGALLAASAYPLAPADARPFLYFLIGSSSLVPAAFALRRRQGPAVLIVAALVVINVGGLWAAIQLDFTAARNQASLGFIVAGHLLLLVAALWIVLRRGRGDVGGIIDAVVMAVGLAALLWTVVLQPRLEAGSLSAGNRAALLTMTLSLAGMMGALLRVERSAREAREVLLALRAFLVVIPLALIGNTSLIWAGTADPLIRPGWIDALFLAGYIVAGAGVADRSMVRLLRPGPVPVDRLGPRRLAFLGGALALDPIVAGVQQIAGRPIDAVLLAVGTGVMVPLVMIRIGRLAAQRLRAEQALAHEATHDSLTGLANRKRFLAALDAELAAGSSPLIYFCDLNGFKAVNDRLGHVAGDELLQSVATRLAGCVREGDTLARYGGDEFVILCADAGNDGTDAQNDGADAGNDGTNAGDDAGRSILRRIEAAFALPFEVSGEPADVGLSIGAVRAEPGADAVSVLRRADGAMYVAKSIAKARDERVALSFAA